VRFLFASARKDLQRLRREPVQLAVWMGIPLMATVLLSLVFGGEGVTPHGLLLVADEDGSMVSSIVSGAFTREPLSDMVTVEKVLQAEGRRRIDNNRGSALLIIPKGFGAAVLRNEPVRAQLVTNPSQSILPDIVKETLSMLFDAAFYLQATAGPELRAIAGNPGPESRTYSDARVAAVAVSINGVVARVLPYLDPPRIGLEIKVIQEKAAPSKGVAALMFPGMLFLAVLFLAQGMSEDLWREQAQGTLRRLAATPGTLAGFLGGKLLSIAAVLAAVAAAALAAAHWLLRIPVNNSFAAVGWLIGTGSVLFLLMLLVQSFASGQRAGGVLVSAIVFPLAMLGGSFFPFDMMPAGLAAIGRWTPNGWSVTRLDALMMGAADFWTIVWNFGVVVGAGALAFLVLSARVRRRFLN
jgi:ABC-type multidrug transport system permease subunit